MNTYKIFTRPLIVFCILVVAVSIVGCRKKVSDEIDFGTLENSIYQNKYFEFTIHLPADWSVQDRETQQEVMEMGGNLVAGNDKNLKAMFKASEMQSINLFAVFKSPLGSPVPFNPSIMGVADRVQSYPGIKRGKDYLFHAKQMLESGQVKVSFSEEIHTKQLDGVDFDVLESEMLMGGIKIKQKCYAAIVKNYALMFIMTFRNEDEEAFQQKVLDTIVFTK